MRTRLGKLFKRLAERLLKTKFKEEGYYIYFPHLGGNVYFSREELEVMAAKSVIKTTDDLIDVLKKENKVVEITPPEEEKIAKEAADELKPTTEWPYEPESGLPLCQCGCGKPATPRRPYAYGHKPKPESKPCECGCGEDTSPGKRFIFGHGTKNISPAEKKTKADIKQIGKKFAKPKAEMNEEALKEITGMSPEEYDQAEKNYGKESEV